MTPTLFVYNAMLASGGRVPAPRGKVIEYEPIERGPLEGDCWLCGAKNVTGYPRSKVIKPTFTDSNLARSPWSEVVCDACTWALSYRSLRSYSILATSAELIHPTRQELRDVLIDPPAPPFLIAVSQTGQKWLHLKSQVNYSRDAFKVRFEDLTVRVEPGNFASVLEFMERMLAVFSKSEIATGEYAVHRIQQFGLEQFDLFEGVLRPLRGSAVFALALHVATIPEREKTPKKSAERRKPKCTTASRQGRKTLLLPLS